MKKLTVALFFVSGLLFAQDQSRTSQSQLSETEREALRTQSPPVKTHGKHNKKQSNYIVTKNKTTIVAVKPYNQ